MDSKKVAGGREKESGGRKTTEHMLSEMDQWKPTIYLYMEKKPGDMICVCHLRVKVEVVMHV